MGFGRRAERNRKRLAAGWFKYLLHGTIEEVSAAKPVIANLLHCKNRSC